MKDINIDMLKEKVKTYAHSHTLEGIKFTNLRVWNVLLVREEEKKKILNN